MVRKFIVEVVDAHHLMPKDGHGSISPYVQVSFYNHRKNTQTIVRNLNPVWNETLSFDAPSLSYISNSILKLIVYHDQNVCKIRRDNFLGQIELSSTVFVAKGKEVLQYYQLKNSWTRCFQLKMIKDESEIGLKMYYVDEEEFSPHPHPPPSPPPPLPPSSPPLPQEIEEVEPNDVTTPLQELSREPAPPPPPSPPLEIEEMEPNDVTTPLAVPEIVELEPPAPQAEPPREDDKIKEEPPAIEGSMDQVNQLTPATRNILRKLLDCQNFVGKILKKIR